jgi:hypothetical protein
MAPASIVFPDPLFLFQTPDENDEWRFHCIRISVLEGRVQSALYLEMIVFVMRIGWEIVF